VVILLIFIYFNKAIFLKTKICTKIHSKINQIFVEKKWIRVKKSIKFLKKKSLKI
jgi:hypothetical protein